MFNREGFNILNYKIYTIAGDGCLQEGVSSEASSLAGHLKLNNLIVIYDDNHITIDGKTELVLYRKRRAALQSLRLVRAGSTR